MSRFVDNNHEKVIEGILSYYYSKIQGDYIPAILNEGSLFSPDGFVNDDLYIKLIAVKKETHIRNTWMLHNLSSSKENGSFNFIVEYKYLRKNIFGIHPDLLCDSSVSLCKQEDDNVLTLEFLDASHKINGDRILKYRDNNVLINFPFIHNFSDKADFSFDYEYDLFIEIEYRTFNDNLLPIKTGPIEFRNGFVDLSYESNDAGKNNGVNKLYWLRATIKLETNKIISCKDNNNELKISVVDLETRNIRKLNPDNFDDDMHAGLIVFSNEAVNFIKKYYYFYDLYLIPKISNIQSCLIDVLDDCVVFWEGEFNSNLPFELKKEIQKYNLVSVKEHIISDAMYRSQLLAQWDIYKYLLPNQQLGRQMLAHYRDVCFEQGIDFYPPRSENEYSVFIEKFFKATGLDINGLHISKENKEKLKNILLRKYVFQSAKDMYINYQGLCLLFLRELGFNSEQE